MFESTATAHNHRTPQDDWHLVVTGIQLKKSTLRRVSKVTSGSAKARRLLNNEISIVIEGTT
jgi:hypothetical protein